MRVYALQSVDQKTISSEEKNGFRLTIDVLTLEKQRNKLISMHHAASCTNAKCDGCPKFKHCAALKRMHKHVISCSKRGKCEVPGCKKMRSVWGHFRGCVDEGCQICSVISVPRGVPVKKVYHRQSSTDYHFDCG